MNTTINQTWSFSGIAPDLLWGLLLGLLASFVFFQGLAWGMQKALQSKRPGPILLLSFLIRTIFFLVIGWGLIQFLQPVWALLGYGLAFFIVRSVLVRSAKRAGTQQL